jgi:hypothetical protein
MPVCLGAGIQLVPGAFLILDTPAGHLPFQISQVRSAVPLQPVEVAVRLVGRPEALALVKPGDVDLGLATNALAAGAHVLAVGAREPGGPDGLASEVVTLKLDAQHPPDGWRYVGEPLRAGASFLLRTVEYEIRGSVLRVSPPRSKSGE